MYITTEICWAVEDKITNLMLENSWTTWKEFSEPAKIDIYSLAIEKFGNTPDFIDLFLMQTYLIDVLRGTFSGINPNQNAKEALMEYLSDMLHDALSRLVEEKVRTLVSWSAIKLDKIDSSIQTQSEEDEENLRVFNRTEAQSINAEFKLPHNSLNDL
jgi:hypothetical protein